jgi:RNA polymerase sigma-70 factor (ECF subfamily)
MSETDSADRVHEHLAAARRGDTQGFSALTEPYRRELQIHCYRILGSLQDAEDLVQETFLRAWRRLDTYEGRASFRAWLYKIATHACLDALDRMRSRRLLPAQTYPVSDPHAPIQPPVTEAGWLEPFPDEWLVESAFDPEARYSLHESVSLAFLIALQALPSRQRAALILSDVLDWSAREVAELLGLSVSAANSVLYRARATMAKHYHGRDPRSLDAAATDERTQRMLDRFVQVWETADVAGLVALLKEDATLAMPPSPSWYGGRDAIGVFAAAALFADGGMFGGAAAGRWRLRPTRANGQFAFAIYQRMGDAYQAFGLHVLAREADKIVQIISFIDPSLFARFGLAERLESP